MTKLTVNKTRVLFKFVPTEVPNYEIINLCNTYGRVESDVISQTIVIQTVPMLWLVRRVRMV